MYCLTRYEMKFGDLIIPARTECTVVNRLNTDTVDASGVHIKIVVSNRELNFKDVENENKVIKFQSNVNDAALCGVVIYTNTTAVYMNAGDRLYKDTGVYNWQLEKIFGENNVPKELVLGKYRYNGKDAKLQSVIDYLEDEFSSWVQENCDFYILTEDDIEKGDGFDGAEPGDRTLSDEGLSKFYKKELEYQNKLETIGFTYDFNGGLIWD